MRVRVALVLVCLLGCGCAQAILSRITTRSHQAYSDADFAEFLEIRELGQTGKAEVLATLGPPIEVLSQDSGDVFVYRRRIRESTVINLNPNTVTFGPPVPIPLFFRSSTSGRDDTLMLFFGPDGRLRGDSLRLHLEAFPVGEDE